MKGRKNLNQIRLRRKRRTRAKILGTAKRPRLSVFRSNRYTYAQLIDDAKGQTLASASTRSLKTESSATPLIKAGLLGELIASKAKQFKINKVVFDRGRYKYHGRVKAVSDGARKGGIQF